MQGGIRSSTWSPGLNSVAFEKPGFASARQNSVILTTGFTAQVNHQLQLGAVNESIAVQAEAPVVDVQDVATYNVINTNAIESLPTNRTLQSMTNLVPGGGSGTFGNPSFRGNNDAQTMVDGGRVTNMIGAGPGLTTNATNQSAYQEFSFSTAWIRRRCPRRACSSASFRKMGATKCTAASSESTRGPDGTGIMWIPRSRRRGFNLPRRWNVTCSTPLSAGRSSRISCGTRALSWFYRTRTRCSTATPMRVRIRSCLRPI